MLEVQQRLTVNVLWTAGYDAGEIAEITRYPIAEVQRLIDIFERRFHAVLPDRDHCRFCDQGQ